MLVLSRREEEEILFVRGNECFLVLKVLEIRKGQVKLGFDATPETIIQRAELMDGALAGRATPYACLAGSIRE